MEEALGHPGWLAAMKEEYLALIKNNTWSLVSLPSNKTLISCKWAFRVKKHADGSVQKLKTRLVAKGFHQRQGFDFTNTFSPVVKPTTIRSIFSITVSKG